MIDEKEELFKILDSRSKLILGVDRTPEIENVIKDVTHRLWVINSKVPGLDWEPAFFL